LSRKIKIPEEDLIALLKQNDEKGFTILYDNYSSALYGVILKIVRSEEIAADVMQESFVKIWKNISLYEKSKGALFTWILNIARNSAIDKIRSQDYRQNNSIQSVENNVNLIENQTNTQTNFHTDFIGVDKIINQLRPEYQLLIDLIYLKGYTQAEVSEEFNIPLGTVKTRIKAAINQLRVLVL